MDRTTLQLQLWQQPCLVELLLLFVLLSLSIPAFLPLSLVVCHTFRHCYLEPMIDFGHLLHFLVCFLHLACPETHMGAYLLMKGAYLFLLKH